MVAASADPHIAAGEVIDVRDEGDLLDIFATRAGGEERVGELPTFDYTIWVTGELPGCLLVKTSGSPRLLLAPLTGVQAPTTTPAASSQHANRNSSALSGSRTVTPSPASEPSRSNAPKCQYRGCSQTDHLELCATDGRRLACRVHRTLRNGSYACKSCDEELAAKEAKLAAAAAERRAQSHHKLLLFGTIASIVLGVLVFMWFIPHVGLNTRQSRDDLLIVVIIVLIVLVAGVGLYRTDAFRIGRMGQLDGLEVGVYWLAAVPAFLALSVVVIGLLMLGAFAKEEYSVAQDREWIRRRITDL